MLDFSWNQWLSAVEKFTGSNKGRKVRRAKTARIELLEDRALLTANLPVAVDDAYAVAQNGTLNGTTVLVNDTDADGDTIDQAELDDTTSHGTLVLQSNGTFTYTPDAGFTGIDSFTYFAVDSTNDESSAVRAVVRINVGAVADAPPTATPTAIDVIEDTPFDGGLSGNDPENAALTFLPGSTPAVNGTVVVNSDGSFTFTPNAGFVGAGSFTFRVSDGTSTSADATVTVNVLAGGNTAPVGTNATFANVPGGVLFTGALAGTDADGDTLVFAGGSTAPAHGTVTIGPDGTFTYLPDAGYFGTDSFTFTVNDGQASSGQATVSLTVNGAPTATPTAIDVIEDTPFDGQLSANDPEDDPLTFLAGTTPPVNGTVVINPDGSFTFTPTAGFVGAASFTFRVTDGTSTSANATVTVNVLAAGNTAPVGTNASFTVPAEVLFTGTLTGTDADGDTLVFAGGSTAPAHGTVTISPDGTFTYQPDAGYTGPDSFTFTVNDGQVSSGQATVLLTVNGGPTATPTAIDVIEDTPFDGQLSGNDPEDDPLTFLAGTTPAVNGTVTIDPDGSFTFTPNAGFVGAASFTFRVSDGTSTSANATVTVNVLPAGNTAPVANNASFTVAPDVLFNGTLTGTDADGDPLVFAGGSTAPAHGTVTINPNGTFTYQPDAGYIGPDSFTFTVNDGQASSGQGTVTLKVNGAPVVLPAAVTTVEDTPVSGTLTGTDPNGDSLTFAVGATAPTNGTVVINPDGTYTFTPTAGFVGTASFSYKANDGTVDSAEAIVTVTVEANEAPVVVDGSGTTPYQTPFVGSVSPLGTDPENDALTFSVVTQPTHGTLALSPDGTFTYTPNAGFSGADSFTFKANDGKSDSNIGTFVLTVEAQPSPLTLDLAPTGTIATRGKKITALDPTATLINVDPTVNFGNTTIVATFVDGSDPKHDRLLVKKIPNSALRATNKKIFLNGNLVATISGGKKGAPLTISFGSTATQANVNAVLQRIASKTTRIGTNENRTVRVDVNAPGAFASDTIILAKV